MDAEIKVGDVVRVLDLRDIEANSRGRGCFGGFRTSSASFMPEMIKYCGGEYTVERVSRNDDRGVDYNLDGCGPWWFNSEVIELVDGDDCQLVCGDFDVNDLF